MKNAHPPLPTSPEEIAAAIDSAPEWVDDPECPYDPNDPAEVAAFWQKAKVVDRSKGSIKKANPKGD